MSSLAIMPIRQLSAATGNPVCVAFSDIQAQGLVLETVVDGIRTGMSYTADGRNVASVTDARKKTFLYL